MVIFEEKNCNLTIQPFHYFIFLIFLCFYHVFLMFFFIYRAPSFSNPSNVVGQLAAKLAALHIRRGSKLLTASSSSSNTRKNSVAYTGVKGNMEERSLLRSGGNVCELGLLRDGSMQAVYTEASAQDSEPEVKYRAIRHLKLVVYDDAKVIMSRKSLKSGGSDLDSPRDGDRSIWSPKETPISWTPLPGQKLNRWNTTF